MKIRMSLFTISLILTTGMLSSVQSIQSDQSEQPISPALAALITKKPECKPIDNKQGLSFRVVITRHGEQPTVDVQGNQTATTEVGKRESLANIKGTDLTLRGIQRSFGLIPFFINELELAGTKDIYRFNPANTITKNKTAFATDASTGEVFPPVFGKPVSIYAPKVTLTTNDIKTGIVNKMSERSYQLIMQTATFLNVPVNTSFAYVLDEESAQKPKWTDPAYYCDLVQQIAKDAAGDKLALIAWDHKAIPALAQAFLTEFGGATLPEKTTQDKNFHNYDRFYFIRVENGKVTEFRNIPQALLANDSDPDTEQIYELQSDKLVWPQWANDKSNFLWAQDTITIPTSLRKKRQQMLNAPVAPPIDQPDSEIA